MERLLTAREVASLLRMTQNRLYELAKIGGIPCVRVGHRIRFSEAELMEWIRSGGTQRGIGADS